MLLSEISLGAAPPLAHEIVVERSTDGGTEDGYQSPRPLLRHLRACLGCNPPDNAGHESLNHFLLQEVLANVHAGGARSRNPQLGNLGVGGVPKAVNQA